jgi:ribosome biogenesis GTPase
MAYDVLPLSLQSGSEAELGVLLQHLTGKSSLVLGPSGAGKSTLINRLIPGALAQTGCLSQALNSGKHTTTSTTWYWLGENKSSALIDSPGFQEFGLNHIDAAQLVAYMPDLLPHVTNCKFYNCSHLHEPGCGVIAAVKSDMSAGSICANRYKIYSDLYAELSQIRNY